MLNIGVDRDVAAGASRAAHEVALAALLGGNLFGRVAMHPALTDVSDKAERGRVLNRAWRRYGTIESLALATLVAGWLPERLNGLSSRSATQRERLLMLGKDVAMGAVVVTGLASAAGGVGFAQQAPGGAVPMSSGSEAAPEASHRAARLKRAINALGALNLIASVALAAADAALIQAEHRTKPSLLRSLRRAL